MPFIGREDKFWPPMGRIDNVCGDEALACVCLPMEAHSYGVNQLYLLALLMEAAIAVELREDDCRPKSTKGASAEAG